MNTHAFLRAAALTAISAVALSISAAPTDAGVVVLQFPGCGTTLQKCIDDADPGRTIIVGQDIVNESIEITKSVTLQGAPGFRPRIEALDIDAKDASTLDITIQTFEIERDVDVELFKGTGHSVSLLGLKVDGEPIADDGISLDTSVPASFDVEGNTIHASGNSGRDIIIHSVLTEGSTIARVVGNRVEQRNNPDSGAGIELLLSGAGSFRADVMNNVVWDVAACHCGSEDGVTAEIDGTLRADVNLVGNTIVGLRADDFFLDNGLVPGGHLALDMFNNIVAKSAESAIQLDSKNASTVTFRAGDNDFFQNAQPNSLQGNSLGSGNLHVDPRFQSLATGKFTLLGSSPVVDQGIVCSPGGVADPDAAGNHRLFGASVDLGAFERGAAKPTGIVEVGGSGKDGLAGTNGDDILCGNGGADTLNGRPGADYLDGGPGADILFGDTGNDRLFGQSGNDSLCAKDGVKGNDQIDGGKGTDKFQADSGDVRRSVERPIDCKKLIQEL